jgi:hypothetical protein
MKQAVEYSPEFRQLMRKAEVSMSHLQPRNSASVATTMASDTVDTIRGLAEAYGVPAGHMIRAAIVIGLEELLGCAKELKHGP